MKKQHKIEDFLDIKMAVAPRWNFDDSQIIYRSNKSGTMQLYIMSVEGREERQLTDYPDPIESFSVSSVKNEIVFSKAEKGNEQAQLYFLDIDTQNITTLTDDKSVRHNLGSWSQDGRYVSFSSTERNGTDFDVYVMDMETHKIRCVFSGGGRCHSAGFSPSARLLVITQYTTSVKNNDLYLCNLETGLVQQITEDSTDANYGSVVWSSDEESFFVGTNKDREFFALAKYDIGKETFKYVLIPKWNINNYSLSRDGKQMLTTVNEDGYVKLLLYKTDTFEPVECDLPKGSFGGFSFSKDGTQVVYSFGDSHSTYNIYIHNLKIGKRNQITNSFQGVPKEELVEPGLIHYSSFDGLSVPAFVYKPKDIPEDAKLPVIINIHGGPFSQHMPGFNPFMQYFVKVGYIVVAPNVRGSSGYGKTYLALDDVEKRMDSVKDIVALREHLATLSNIDTDKIILMGGSYGGFMVYACLAFYPKLWAGGISVVGIANFITFLKNTAPYGRASREAEYGSLENDREFLESISPINAIDNVQAPLLIIHGANDSRVPLSEAEQMKEKLQKQGKTVELIVYSDEGHGISKHKNKVDLYPKIIAFLERIIDSA